MLKFSKRFPASALLACLPLALALALAACGGGGGGGGGGASVETTTVSGTAIKGPIKGALVQVFKLNGDGAKGELLGSGTSDGSASYAVAIPKAKAVAPLLVTVSGQAGASYTSESTGSEVPFGAAEEFRAVLDTFDAAKKFTVSPLTEAAYQQVQKVLTDSPSSVADARLIGAANARVASLFNVSDILAAPATDASYSAALKIIDRMVEDSKGNGATNTLQTMALIDRGLADTTGQVYQGFRSALNAAAAAVVAGDPSAASAVNAIVSTAAAPPAEPNWTDTTAPQAVTDLRATAGAEATASSVTLAWSAAATAGGNPVAGYDVYRDGVKTASVASPGYLDASLPRTTTYAYYVVAFDAAGNRSVASAAVSATTPSAPNLDVAVDGQLSSGISELPQQDVLAPTAPTNLSASATAISATDSSVLLTWSPSSDNALTTGYEIYRNGVPIAAASLPSYTDPSVASGATYSYFVRASDAAGNRSVASSPLSVTPNQASLGVTVSGQLSSGVVELPQSDITPPTAPAGLSATASATSATASSVQLAWSPSSDDVAVTGYDVYRNGGKIATVALPAYLDASVASGVAYAYHVVSFDAAANRSQAGNQLQVTPNQASLGVTASGQVSPPL